MAPRRRNPKGAGVLRAIAALLLLDGPHRERLRRRALRSHHNTPARDPLYFHHGLRTLCALAAFVLLLLTAAAGLAAPLRMLDEFKARAPAGADAAAGPHTRAARRDRKLRDRLNLASGGLIGIRLWAW